MSRPTAMRSRESQNRPLSVLGNKGGVGLTQDEIADKLGCSRAYVSQVERRALAKLRAKIAAYPYLAEGLSSSGRRLAAGGSPSSRGP